MTRIEQTAFRPQPALGAAEIKHHIQEAHRLRAETFVRAFGAFGRWLGVLVHLPAHRRARLRP